MRNFQKSTERKKNGDKNLNRKLIEGIKKKSQIRQGLYRYQIFPTGASGQCSNADKDNLYADFFFITANINTVHISLPT